MKVRELAANFSMSNILQNTNARKLFFQLICFGCGFVAAGGRILGNYAPFGISVASAVPFKGLLSSVIGSSIGYMVMGGRSGNFRYIAAMLAVAAIRWTLHDIKKLNRHSLYAAAVCFVPALATGMASLSVTGISTQNVFRFVIEALIGAAAAYFFSRTVVILNGTRSLGMLLMQEVACLVLSGCIFILSLSGITIGPVSLGRIAAIVCILMASRYGSTSGGAVAGISTGIVLSLADPSLYFIGAAYSLGGLMSGIFSQTGKLISCLIFTAGVVLVSFQGDTLSSTFTMVYECAAASLIFIILPKNTGNFISAVFTSSKDENCEGLRRSIIMRLDFASKALSDVSDDVEEVADRLARIVTPTLDSVYEKAVDSTCKRCGLRVFCWEHRDGVSIESFQTVNDKLIGSGSITPEDFCEDFKRKCCRSAEMARAVNKCYQNYLASEAASKRVDEVRSVVAGQFCGLGDILGEMADEYENYEFFDNELSDRIFMKFKELGMTPTEVSCRVDHLGRMTVEAGIYDDDRRKIKRNVILHEVSKICGRHFETPCVTAAFGRCRILLSERPAFDVEIASSQHVCGSGLLCGDNLRYFNDGMGRMITVLSDGMGTGGRAAVDGGMAVSIISKLIKAGLGFDCSLKVVNSALLVKSEDESLATLDVVSVDLYTGDVDFMKAGAAVSFIRKSGEMYRVETPSLPVGILPDVEFTCTEDNLSPDDIIVMVSDGAVACGEDWIERIIMKWSDDKDMQELAHLINDEAASRREDGHDDDITVIAMRITTAFTDLSEDPALQIRDAS